MAIAGGVGAEVDLDPLVELRGCSGETALFGEGPGGIVLAVGRRRGRGARSARADAGVDAVRLGTRRRRPDRDLGRRARGVAVLVADAERAWRSLGETMDPA